MNDENPFSPPEQDAPPPSSGSGTPPEQQRWPIRTIRGTLEALGADGGRRQHLVISRVEPPAP